MKPRTFSDFSGRIFARRILIFLPLLFFLSFGAAEADVLINEIAMDPIEDRFLELYNSGDESVDLTGWYIQRKTQTSETFGTFVTKTNFEGKSIPPGGFFLISRSPQTESDLVLNITITESNSFQIKNVEQEVVHGVTLGDCGDCAPNPSPGKSVQRFDSPWVVSSPTPASTNQVSDEEESQEDETAGAATVTSGEASSASDEDNESEPEDTAPEETKDVKKAPGQTKISAPLLSFVKIPVSFKIGEDSPKTSCGKRFWNFGDGTSAETNFSESEVFHTYDYSGEYVVTMDCFKNSSSKEASSSSRIEIKVIPIDLAISNTGVPEDFFVEIRNNAPLEIDISGWIILSVNKKFTFPENSVVRSKNKMMLSPKVTGFSFADKETLKILNPQGYVVSGYVKPAASAEFSYKAKTGVSSGGGAETPAKAPGADGGYAGDMMTGNLPAAEVDTKDLSANVPSENLPFSPEETENDAFKYGVSGLFVFIIASAGASYYVRRRGRKDKDDSRPGGSDFEIFEG